MKRALYLLTFVFCISCATQEEHSTKVVSRYADPHPIPADAQQVAISGKHGGRVISAILSELGTLNPIVSYDADAQSFNQLMGAGLTRLNLSTQQPEPALAKSWESSENRLSWTFHLRKGLNWSDGHPFTAADVIFTMEVVNDPKIVSGAQDALTINGQRIQWTQVDDFTVTAKLPASFAPFLRLIDGGTVPILPKHKWETIYHQGKFEQAMAINMNPNDYVTMGTFRLKEYKQGDRITLIRNPHYWKKDQQGKRLPYLDEIVFLILPGQDQLLLRMTAGQLDTYQSIRPQDVEEFTVKSKSKKLAVVNLGPSYENEQLFFNQNADRNQKSGKPFVDPEKLSWFTDQKFRRAVSYAIDRDAMVRNILYGNGSAAYGPESPANKLWYNDLIFKTSRNPDKALMLLKASGFVQKTDASGKTTLFDRKGKEVRFSLNTNAGNTIRNAQCNMIASDLRKLGMKVDYAELDFNSLVDRVTATFDYDAALLSLSHDDVDPASGMNIWLSSGSLHFWWPMQKRPQTEWEKRIDELMTLQFSTFDLEKRREYFNEVQTIVTEQQPVIFTINQSLFVCAREGLGNFKPALARHRTLWNADELYWK